MASTYVCTQCGYAGASKTATKGSFLIEVVLWLCFLIPGIIYSLWRLSSRHSVCPKCGGALIPTDSPKGKILLEQSGVTPEQPVSWRDKQTQLNAKDLLKWFGIALLALVGIAFWYVAIPAAVAWYLYRKNQSLPQQTKHIVMAAVAIVFLGAGSYVLFFADKEATSQPIVSAPVQQAPAIEMAFDVPSLLGKNISELAAILGTPDENAEPTATYRQFSDVRTWDKAWYRDGYSLSASYNIDSGKVVDLFVGTHTDAALVTFRNTANILTVGNLTTSDPLYSVEFVKLKAILGQSGATPEGYTGAIVKAK